MDTGWLQPTVNARPPFASVHVDATRDEATSAHEVELRWAAVRERLQSAGAPDEVLEVIGERVLQATGLPGEQGRHVVASGTDVVLDRVAPHRPVRDAGSYGLVPHLMPVVRGLASVVPYALVDVDRAGADVTLVDAFGREQDAHSVEGGHDVLHKFGGGGWSHRRFQMRVEDSWERNAEAVAADLDKVVAEHRPRLVVLAGDPNARTYVRRHATGRLEELLVDVEGGGRADGVSQEALQERVDEVVTRHRQSAMGDVIARFEEAAGRDQAAANGLPAVVEALRGGAVDVLLLHDDPSSTARLWAGPEPLQLGRSEDEVRALGAQEVVVDRADAVLLRALVGQDGHIELIEGADVLRDGIGALLRFDVRPATPG
jgi:peptide subunit release factor 1 (eRF1)